MQTPFTTFAQEALAQAQQAAQEAGHPQVTPLHLFAALMEKREGVFGALFSKLDVEPAALIAEVDRALASLPRQSATGQPLGASPTLGTVLQEASRLAGKLGDDYVSTETLFAALVSKPDGVLAKIFADRRLTLDRVQVALEDVRKGAKVQTPDPESTFDSLNKYARDLTADAKAGRNERTVVNRRIISAAVSPSLPAGLTSSVTTSTAARNSGNEICSASTDAASAPENSVLPRTSTSVSAALASCSDAFDKRGRDFNRAVADSRAALRTTRSVTIASRASHKSSATSAVNARTAHSRVAPLRWPD
ncbi:MAG TPA: Clp protease N-terminal domain-containing protein, partial [Planctomycetota bacterium]|nr:Clp protease N-terminal domain-containing protein [Planctomycetota bacterium]